MFTHIRLVLNFVFYRLYYSFNLNSMYSLIERGFCEMSCNIQLELKLFLVHSLIYYIHIIIRVKLAHPYLYLSIL